MHIDVIITTDGGEIKISKESNDPNLPLVGIGASAGGLQALKSFLSNIPTDRDEDVSFVIIQHLDPEHESVLDTLLEKLTDMKIRKIEDGMKVEPNCVYVNPPNKKIRISESTFRTSEFEDSDVPKLPIDHFFRSLSEIVGKKSICIVLSGTGSDGSTGLKEIKGAGGMTMAQEIRQAEYKGMPQSAINTGLVDHVLPVEEMPQKIYDYVKHPYIDRDREIDIGKKQYSQTAPKIFELIRQRIGHDFSGYKTNTIRRRINRRMAVHQIDKIADYYDFLKNNRSEVENLFKDILITVTNFFREIEVFESLKDEIIPELLETRSPDTTLRIWVPGCSTGEEAYSIAMLLTELREEREIKSNIQIFATDIDSRSIDIARKGLYPESIAADVPKKRLERFFEKKDDKYKISDKIRKKVVFAEQNLIMDPPLSRMDLISCRNVLIYMDRELQKKIIPMLYYALNKDGYLILGTSESIAEYNDLFESVDKKKSIFRRKETADATRQREWGFVDSERKAVQAGSVGPEGTEPLNVKELAEGMILKSYSYPGVLIDKNYEILYFHGDTGKYLSPPEGKPNLSILNMARGNLRYSLTPIIQEAKKQKSTAERKDVKVKCKDEEHIVDLIVSPVKKTEDSMELLMVVFKEKTKAGKTDDSSEDDSDDDHGVPMEENDRIEALEKELKSTKESLQATIEELETSNEELRSRNEELKATNEELRSTNEELKTAREETRSTNEELTTVNQELEEKISELSQEKNDMRNLLEVIEVPIVFLDTDHQVRRFTPEATHLFKLIDSDIGRPLNDISSSIRYENIEDDLDHVLDTLQKVTKEIQTDSGDWYEMEILPYRTIENVVDGVVLTFKDITKVKRRRLKKLRRLATVVEDSYDAITVLDLDGDIEEWNTGAENMYGYSRTEAKDMNIREIIPEDQRKKEKELLEKVKSGEEIESFKTKRLTEDDRVLDVWATITELVDEDGDIYAVATTERDITELEEREKNYEKRITELESELEERKTE
ncbi:MAG: CheR family methyltransferase [Thermoplasmata archaeon]